MLCHLIIVTRYDTQTQNGAGLTEVRFLKHFCRLKWTKVLKNAPRIIVYSYPRSRDSFEMNLQATK